MKVRVTQERFSIKLMNFIQMKARLIGTQQTIYSTLLDAMRLKVPELIRHFDDNLRPKASNCSIVLWTLLRPKASNLRRIQYRFGTEAPKSVEFAPKILLYFGRCCAQKR